MKWQSFLWYLATSDTQILNQVEDRTERIWHSIIGTFVLITGTFAFITGSFTMSLILGEGGASSNLPPWFVPLVFGLIWGVLIITIDRLLIASIATERRNKYLAAFNKVRKEDTAPTPEGEKNAEVKNRDWAKTWIFVCIRLGIALLISLLITKPFELWLYQDQIALEAMKQTQQERMEFKDKLVEDSSLDFIKENIDRDSAEVKGLFAEIKKAEWVEEYRELRNQKRRTIRANSREIRKIESFAYPQYYRVDTSKRPSPDTLFINAKGEQAIKNYKRKNYQAQKDTSEARKRLLNKGVSNSEIVRMKVGPLITQVESLKDSIGKQQEERENEIAQIEADSDSSQIIIQRSMDDLFGKLEALHAYVYDENNPDRKYMSWLILFIFLTIETLPIVSKMASSSGEYERRLISRHQLSINQLEKLESKAMRMEERNTRKRESIQAQLQELTQLELSVDTFLSQYDQAVNES
ncbi:MAG: DUF4407 domain-containing protein [Bacteroidota bacterium]